MSQDLLFALISFAFVMTVTPGPNNLMLIASGTNYGFIRTIPHLLGIACGIAIMLLVVGAGLIQVFEIIPYSYTVLKGASVLYLLYLAWKIATALPPDLQQTQEAKTSRPLTFLQAALFQWVNPKAWAMCLSAVSAYSLPDHRLASLLLIALIFIIVGLPSTSCWVILGTQLRRMLTRPVQFRTFNILAALLLVASLWPILRANTGQ